jgi:hypothetical protein
MCLHPSKDIGSIAWLVDVIVVIIINKVRWIMAVREGICWMC